MIDLVNVSIDQGPNPLPDAPCPGCGNADNVQRTTVIGISLKDAGRICATCIDSVLPEGSDILGWVADLEWLLTNSPDRELLTIVIGEILPPAIQTLLIDYATQGGNR